ncbi:MAG: hypothetical protein JXA78_11220 [Anaerolineales bacterium]|nr:hypothetical protein [Anaerolineales bacterium]
MLDLKLSSLVLGLPSGVLRKVSYVWFGVVVFYTISPPVAGVLAALLLLSLALLSWQKYIWARNILRRGSSEGQEPYVDHPKAPVTYQARNLALALIASGAVTLLFGGSLGLSNAQWFMLVMGFFVLQMDLALFGAPTVYILTAQGLGIGYADIRLFLEFGEIRKAVYLEGVEKRPERWSMLTPVRSARQGVLLLPARSEGFTRLIDQVFLAPTDVQRFLAHFPPGIVAEPAQALDWVG